MLDIVVTLSLLAAIGLAVLMADTVIVHVRRQETARLAVPLALAVIPTALAVPRLGLYGF